MIGHVIDGPAGPLMYHFGAGVSEPPVALSFADMGESVAQRYVRVADDVLADWPSQVHYALVSNTPAALDDGEPVYEYRYSGFTESGTVSVRRGAQ